MQWEQSIGEFWVNKSHLRNLTIYNYVSGVMFGGHVRFVFTFVLFIFVFCVLTTLTSFREIPLDILTNPFKVKKKLIIETKLKLFCTEKIGEQPK